MSIEKAAQALRVAQKAITTALEALERLEVREAADQYAAAQKCKVCEKAIHPDEPTRRGVHLHCYNAVYAEFVKTGLKSLKDLEDQGLIGPPGKSGRKSRDISTFAGVARNRIDGNKQE